MGLVIQSIYNYNVSGIETRGFLVHSGNIPKRRPYNDLTDSTGTRLAIERDEEDRAHYHCQLTKVKVFGPPAPETRYPNSAFDGSRSRLAQARERRST